jgi:hypothetical protein
MEIDDAKFRKLIDGMLRLLIQYETELTAYRHVVKAADDLMHQRKQTRLHFEDALNSETDRPGLYEAAEAEYVEFEPILHPISPQELPAALDRALSAIARIANRNK